MTHTQRCPHCYQALPPLPIVPKVQGDTLARLKRAGYRLVGWKGRCAIVHFTR